MLVQLIKERVLGQAPKRSIPAMDGAWRPNDTLEHCDRLPFNVAEPTGLAWSPDETLFIASGSTVLAADGPRFDTTQIVTAFEGAVRALSWHPSTGLVAAVSGRGLFVGVERGGPRRLSETGGAPLRHPTGVAVSSDGTIFATEGSASFPGDDWVRDLMSKGESGRLVRFEPASERGEVIAGGLAFPVGLALDPAGSPVVSECWRHRVLRFAQGRPDVVLDNLPAYPGTLLKDTEGWWLSFFAPRSHIVEFVLEEDAFRQTMMDRIPPDYWIAPSTDAGEHHFHPVQVGSLRSQNIKKPWAPARSYGLVAKFDDSFRIERTFHSRSNGTRHGTGAMALGAGQLFVAAQGANAILLPDRTDDGR